MDRLRFSHVLVPQRCSVHVRAVCLGAVACASTVGHLRAQFPPLDEYRIESFGPENGLPVSEVWDVARGPSGRLYASTARRVFQFTGDRFRPLESSAAGGAPFRDAMVDTSERLWALTAAGHVVLFEAGTSRRVAELEIQPWRIQEDRHGTIWVSGNRGLAWYRADIDRFEVSEAVGPSRVTGVFFDGRDVVAVTGSGLFRIEVGSDGAAEPVLTRAAGPVTPDALSVAWVDSSGVWIRGHTPDTLALWREGGFERLSPDRAELDRLVRPGLQIQRVVTGSDGFEWQIHVDPDGRSTLVRDGREAPRVFDLRRYRDFRGIQSLLADREGNVWVSTDQGLIQLAPRRVQVLGRAQGLREIFTTAVLQTSDRAVWVATWGGGLHRFADARLTDHWDRNEGLPGDRVRSLLEASDGTVWVGTVEGVAAIRGSVVDEAWPLGPVRAVAEGPGGRIWVGSGQGLFAIDDGAPEASPVAALASADIHALHVDQAGTLWVGTRTGLFRLDGDVAERFGAERGLRDDWVVSIFEDGDGTMWFGTYAHGLHRYRGGRMAPVTTLEGLHHNGIWSMVHDESGGVWLSSDGGLFRVDHARLNAVADAVERGERPDTPLQPLVFLELDGLPSRESNRASPAGVRLADGRLIFNNLGGAIVVDPAYALSSRTVGSIDVQRVEVDGLMGGAGPDDEMVVPPGTRTIAFEFSANAFVAPAQNHYALRLDGYDDDWVDLGTRHRVEYTNLPPRDYVLKVRARTGLGPWGDVGTTWRFRVAPTLWQRPSVRLLLGLTLVGLLFAAHRVRVHHVLEMERTRLQIAADLHDEVGSNLISIALLTDMLAKRPPAGPEARRRRLQRIHDAAGVAVESLREVIWFVDPAHHRLVDLLDRMRETASGLVPDAQLRITAPGGPPTINVRPEAMRGILLAFKEALQNTAKHAGDESAAILIDTDGDRLTFEVVDEGPGFDPERVRPGRGLENMRRRARDLDGALTLDSRPGAGATVRFTARL